MRVSNNLMPKDDIIESDSMASRRDGLNWRYATKKFDPTKKLGRVQIETLLEMINLSPTSVGLQPFKILVVESQDLKEELKSKSFNQQKLSSSSHVLIFCHETSIDENHIDQYVKRLSLVREVSNEDKTALKNMICKWTQRLGTEGTFQWNAKQSYIAMGVLMVACGILRIDACPMEGFDQHGVSELLNLKDSGLTPVLLVPIGYRCENDEKQYMKKVRKSVEELVEYY
jgi:nitroreductase